MRELSRAAVPAVIVVGFLVALAFRGLLVAPERDETHFWQAALVFADAVTPETLRGYGELSTPLPFVVWGLLERSTGYGLALGRTLNCLFGAVLAIVVWRSGTSVSRSARCVVGLLIFPYFLGTSVYLYTDMPAAAAAVGGLALHVRGRTVSAAVLWIIAIACRQYAVAFPLAVVAYEVIATFPRPALRRVVPAVTAAASLGGWFVFFGGFGPIAEIVDQGVRTSTALHVRPQHAVYLLACVGAWFVIPEMILFPSLVRRWSVEWRHALPGAIIVVLLAISFPPWHNVDYPIPTMGFLDKALGAVLPDVARVIVLGCLAVLGIARFRRLDLSLLLVVAHAVLMLKAHIAWDKYALPLLAVLWMISAADQAVRPGLHTAQVDPAVRPKSFSR